MSNYTTNNHLNETPRTPAIFSAITAKSPKQMKALATTITNGLNLLSEGYIFTRRNAAYYIVTKPGSDDVYNVAYDPAKGVASCSCQACVFLGTCKHLVCLEVNKAKIDAANDAREEREERRRKFHADIDAAIAAVSSKWDVKPVDGWDAILTAN